MASHNETVFIADWDEFTRKANYGWLTGDGYRSEKTARREFQTEVLVPAYLSYSDYSGSTVERSNERVWAKEFADSENDAWTTVGGGHGTTAVVIRVEAMTDEMREFLDALENYPVADEGDMSRLEMELQDEAWDNWAEREFKHNAVAPILQAAYERFPNADEGVVEEAVEEAFEKVPDDDIYQMFHDAAEAANEYWQSETGGDQYIDMNRVIDNGLDGDTVLDFLLDNGLIDTSALFGDERERDLWIARRNPNQTSLKFDGLRGGDIATARQAREKPKRFPEGVMTDREWTVRYADRVEAKHGQNPAIFFNRRKFNAMSWEEQRAYDKKIAERAAKTEYRAWRGDSFYVISKTVYEAAVAAGVPAT